MRKIAPHTVLPQDKASAQVSIDDVNILLQYNAVTGENIVYCKHPKYKVYYLGFRADSTMNYSMVDLGKKKDTKIFFKAVKNITEGYIKLREVNGLYQDTTDSRIILCCTE